MHFRKTCLFLELCWLNLVLSTDGAALTMPVQQRDNSPVLNASIAIRDQSGIDVTSSFKIMVNHQERSHILSNRTEKGLNDRQTMAGRLINSCSNGETFVQSHCAPNGNLENSLQRYIYTCRKNITSPRGSPQLARFRTHEGYCSDEELCYDVRTEHPAIVMASCGRIENFEEWHQGKDGRVRPMVGGEIFDPVVSLYGVASRGDGSTPMEMSSLAINTWIGEDEGATKSQAQNKRCRGCVEIETNLLAPQTDSLRVEAMLMSGVSAATAGVLWLTLLTAG